MYGNDFFSIGYFIYYKTQAEIRNNWIQLHCLELCSSQKSDKNDFVSLRNIEITAKQVI